jgi:hypothetical protein
MAGVPVPAYQQLWTEQRSTLKTEYSAIVDKHQDAAASMQQLYKVLCDIVDLASFTPAPVGESGEWAAIVSAPLQPLSLWHMGCRPVKSQ